MNLADIGACPRTSDISTATGRTRYCVPCEVETTEESCFVCTGPTSLGREGMPLFIEHAVVMRENAERDCL